LKETTNPGNRKMLRISKREQSFKKGSRAKRRMAEKKKPKACKKE